MFKVVSTIHEAGNDSKSLPAMLIKHVVIGTGLTFQEAKALRASEGPKAVIDIVRE